MNNIKILFVSVLVAGLGAAVSDRALAQGGKQTDPEKFYRAPGTIHGKTVVLPLGSHFEGRLNETISSKTRQGLKFSIEITSPILANATDVIIPTGSRIIGEVVEAIPSSKQRKVKDQPKPLGKLRTQLSSLITPDGMTYPLVASIMHEYTKSGKYTRANQEIGQPSMGYVGSQTSFDAVHPGFDTRAGGGNRGPKVVGRREFMRDPIMGTEGRNKVTQYGSPVIRAIRRVGNEIYIYSGSPLTVRLDAPLKMSIAPSKGALSIDLDPVTPSLEEGANDGSFRRFQPVGRRNQQQEDEEQEPPPQAIAPVQQAPDPDDGLPAFLRKKKPFFAQDQGGPPAGMQQQAPRFQQQQPPNFQQQPQQQQFQQQPPQQQFQQQPPQQQFQQQPPQQQFQQQPPQQQPPQQQAPPQSSQQQPKGQDIGELAAPAQQLKPGEQF